MTRSELIAVLKSRFRELPQKDVEIAVASLLEGIRGALVSGQRVEIRDFGVFHLNFRKPRMGRNPRTGAKVAVPRKVVPHFKAGKELRERVNNRAYKIG